MAEEISNLIKAEIPGLYFLFADNDKRKAFISLATELIKEGNSKELATIIADSVSFRLDGEEEALKSRIEELEEELQSKDITIKEQGVLLIQKDETIEQLVQDSTELQLEVKSANSEIEFYKSRGATQGDQTVRELLQTVQSLTKQIVDLTSSQTKSMMDLTDNAINKMSEISVRELPSAQVHILQQPTSVQTVPMAQPMQPAQHVPVYTPAPVAATTAPQVSPSITPQQPLTAPSIEPEIKEKEPEKDVEPELTNTQNPIAGMPDLSAIMAAGKKLNGG